MNATRGSRPIRRAKDEERIAIAAYCSARRPLGHGGVGDQHRMVAADDDVDPERSGVGLVLDHGRTCLQRLAERPRRSGDHRVRFAEREHRRGEIVAVLVDHPLDLAAQHAVALMFRVDIVDRAADQRRVAAVEDLIVLRVVDAHVLQEVVDLLAADQHRRAVARFLERDRRAQHVRLLAFGEQHALRVLPRVFIGEAHHRHRRVEPRRAAPGGTLPCWRSAFARRRCGPPLRRRPRRRLPSAADRTAPG